ncbi:hypothetical protein ACFWCA_04220 [Streptomyces phaeochromogenes]
MDFEVDEVLGAPEHVLSTSQTRFSDGVTNMFVTNLFLTNMFVTVVV